MGILLPDCRGRSSFPPPARRQFGYSVGFVEGLAAGESGCNFYHIISVTKCLVGLKHLCYKV